MAQASAPGFADAVRLLGVWKLCVVGVQCMNVFSADKKLVRCSFGICRAGDGRVSPASLYGYCYVVARVSGEGTLAVIGGRVGVQRMEAV